MVVTALAAILVAALIAFTGICAVLSGVWILIAKELGAAWSSIIIGAAALILAFGLLRVASNWVNARSSS